MSDRQSKWRASISIFRKVLHTRRELQVSTLSPSISNPLTFKTLEDFCPMLGLTAPTYQFSAASPNTPNLLTGFATFPGAIGLPSRIGEVRNVFGKKNAKEECAREIWQELKLLARKRGFEMADSDED